jgi:predicted AlkP superfamily pyrophosphatase or phosphodiesterase
MKFLISCLLVLGFHFNSFNQSSATPPKLVVGIVVDQMCYEYLYRFQSKFSDSGFLKLMSKGTNCRNAQYNYVPTYTGPGHASIYTGTTPSNHGIVANQWFVKKDGKSINCVGDSEAITIGSTSNKGNCSPNNLLSYTITDQLKLTYKDAKVISVSIKDRGAILPGGHLSDGSYWFDKTTGDFITSDFYKKSLPTWVNAFNASDYPEKVMKSKWETLYEIGEYKESSQDDSPYEFVFPGKKKAVFPYDLSLVPSNKQFDFFTYTPFANTFLTDFAFQSIKNEQLGIDNVTDFLCISYSSTDILGHAFGPYSVELEDMYLRLDKEIARLISTLEAQFGKDNFVLFLTADHAVVPVPQYLVDKKLPGGYLDLSAHTSILNDRLKVEFGADLIQSYMNNNLYLDDKTIALLSIDKSKVIDLIKDEVATWEGVKAIFTAEELQSSDRKTEWAHMVQQGYVSDRSGDLIFILHPGYLTSDEDVQGVGTSHGSSFNYDTHVPLLWYGKGVKQQEVFRRVNITDITATLTYFLNVQRPNATTGEPILEMFEE